MTVPVPLTRAEQARQTRLRILDTAGKLFSERGHEGTTLQQIADEMGVTKAAVYYYFRTKAEIFNAIVVPEFQAMGDLLDFAETKRYRAERIRVLYGDAPTPDQRAALHVAVAITVAVPALVDLPTDVLRDTLTRTCTRLFRTA